MTKEEEEIASLTDTGKAVTHRGITYAILNPPTNRNLNNSPFILRSPRRRYYALMRNNPKPQCLFGVGIYGGKFKILPGWFTDKDGELKSLG